MSEHSASSVAFNGWCGKICIKYISGINIRILNSAVSGNIHAVTTNTQKTYANFKNN